MNCTKNKKISSNCELCNKTNDNDNDIIDYCCIKNIHRNCLEKKFKDKMFCPKCNTMYKKEKVYFAGKILGSIKHKIDPNYYLSKN
jgi:hypothetical protein